MNQFDVAVIGAGMSGLTCAQHLQQAGLSVVVVEKSRGVGGRVATRRIQATCADHGACYIRPKGKYLPLLVQLFVDRGILSVWTETVHEFEATQGLSIDPAIFPRYIAPAGMTSIAKVLAHGLDLRLGQRVVALNRAANWQLQLEGSSANTSPSPEFVEAKTVVITTPAPQALALLESLPSTVLSPETLAPLRDIRFAPSIAVMAGYPEERQRELEAQPEQWRAISFINDPDLSWIGWDSSKRQSPQQAVFVIQSSATFAEHHLDIPDLEVVGRELLARAGDSLLPWLKSPDWVQTHRWRYAFATRPLQKDYLTFPDVPSIVCCGDWCPGGLIDAAIESGLATAYYISQVLETNLADDAGLWTSLFIPHP